MGNDKRFGDKQAGADHEWGSKGRKEAHHSKKHALDDTAIDMDVNPKPSPGVQYKKRRKDTKRWCRGKEGKEHTPVTVEHHWHSIVTCSVCGCKIKYIWKW